MSRGTPNVSGGTETYGLKQCFRRGARAIGDGLQWRQALAQCGLLRQAARLRSGRRRRFGRSRLQWQRCVARTEGNGIPSASLKSLFCPPQASYPPIANDWRRYTRWDQGSLGQRPTACHHSWPRSRPVRAWSHRRKDSADSIDRRPAMSPSTLISSSRSSQ